MQPELFLVGSIANRIVATVMAGYDGHRGWINYLAVQPNHQGNGNGRQMMAEAVVRLKGSGLPEDQLAGA